MKMLVQDMLVGVGGGIWKTPTIKSLRARRGEFHEEGQSKI